MFVPFIVRVVLLEQTVLSLGLGVLAHKHGAPCVLDYVIAHTSEEGAPNLSFPSRSDDNHVDSLLLGHLTQRLPWLQTALVANMNVVDLKTK